MNPENANAVSCARTGLMPNDCAARLLSRVAMSTRPVRDRRILQMAAMKNASAARIT